MKTPLKYRLRKWLLRPNVRLLGLFISVGGAFFGFLSWTIKPSSPNNVGLSWGIRIASVLCFSLPITTKIWLARIGDLVPDFLSSISASFFERDGLCFLFSVEKNGQKGRVALYYQNRFDKPCEAKLFIGPTRKAFADLDGLPTFRFIVNSQPGEFGKQCLTWSVPLRFQGKRILWDVAAQVKYPAGRGNLLRGRNGAAVGDHLISGGEEAVKAATGLVMSFAHIHSASKPARVELTLPKDLEPFDQQLPDLQSQTIWKLGDPIKHEV